MLMENENYLQHYGILRKSGRYPWGSGNNPVQRSRSFLDIIKELEKQGMSQAEISKSFSTKEYPFTVNDLRATKSRSSNLLKQEQIRTAERLKDKGMSVSAIGRQMGVNESTIRSLLAPGRQEKLDILQATAEMLKREVEEKGFVDVGSQVHRDLPIGDNPETRMGISKDKFNTALAILKEEGYPVHGFRQAQVGTGEYTNYKVLTKPGTTQKEAFLNRHNVQTIAQKSDDGGRTYNDLALKPPLPISSKRVGIRWKEEGGADADGVIYVRPGVPDVTLGKSTYAQVRIAIDGLHYLKGMAVYKEDLPPGVDLLFNTNKPKGDKLDAMKPMKTDKDGNIDPTNPFGAQIKFGGQLKDEHGNVISAMNKVNEEGDWNTWSRTVSRQVLAKQAPDLAKSQLDLTYERRRQEYEEIKALTNPVIKKKLLESFGNETDSAAVILKAANMPRQATKVLLPVKSMNPKEIFAPTFENGDRVALVRFPHAGTFEIPQLMVNNRNREARALFGIGKGGMAPDVVGIHPKVAEHMSGADFDGDHVVVFLNNRNQIKSTKALDGLKGFDPQIYKVPLGPVSSEHPNGKPIIKDQQKQNEMGRITNLIADMTVKGASSDHLARAVRHSMVVIDSEKHNLDFKASERDSGILELKRRYQGVNEKTGQLRGASTLITRATARTDVPRRKARLAADGGPIDKVTGRKMYSPTGEVDKRGNVKKFRSKKLTETHDAFTLVSEGKGTEIEKIYAAHSNKLKTLANESRLEMLKVKPTPISKSAKVVYAKEVATLDSKLNTALKNGPLERQAQSVANMIYGQRRQSNPEMDQSEKKKIRGQALEEARLRVGAKKDRIPITDREWEAIQSGAISSSKLGDILNNTDIDRVRELATPRVNPVMSSTLSARARNMLNSGFTMKEVADALGVAESTLQSEIAKAKE